MIKQITKEQMKAFEALEQPKILFFDVNGCCPCRVVERILAELSEKFTDIHFYKYTVLDILHLEKDYLVSKYQVCPFPTVLFFLRQKEVHRIVGEEKRNDFYKVCELLEE